jgi:hypothetical protein
VKCHEAAIALPKVLPRVWDYCQKHKAAGRTWHWCYPYKLLELWEILQRYRPTSVLEFGSGCTTAVFAEYAATHDEWCRIASVDESKEWQSFVSDEVGRRRVEYLVSSVYWFNESAVGYSEITPSPGCDFIYVDGPSNRIEGTNECARCVDASGPMADGTVKTVLFDIRRETVDYLRISKTEYDWDLGVWSQAGVPWYLSGFRHHTVARRKA